VNQSRTTILELHLSPGRTHGFPGALENMDFATLRMKRRVKDGETLLLLLWDGWLCCLQGLPAPGAAAIPWGLLLEGKDQPSVLGHWQRHSGGGTLVASLLLTACCPVWPCYWEPGRPE